MGEEVAAEQKRHARYHELMGYIGQYLRARDFPFDWDAQTPRWRLAMEVLAPIWRLNEVYSERAQQQEFQVLLLGLLGGGR